MTIVYFDGSEEKCSEIYVAGVNEIILDGRKRVDLVRVAYIKEDSSDDAGI